MLPKEHGAYGQLLFPLVTALAVGRPGASAWLLAAAAVCAFLAHEPLLVLLGQRGPRAAREDGGRAGRWFATFAVAGAACAVAGIAAAAPVVRFALAVPAVIGVALGVAIATRHEHTMNGEILSALALASLSAPLALASRAPLISAITVALAFAAAFVAATVCVHGVIAFTRRPPAMMLRQAGAAVAVVLVFLLSFAAFQGLVKPIAPWAALPVCAGGCVLVTAPPPARELRRVGWVLVGTTSATALILVFFLR